MSTADCTPHAQGDRDEIELLKQQLQAAHARQHELEQVDREALSEWIPEIKAGLERMRSSRDYLNRSAEVNTWVDWADSCGSAKDLKETVKIARMMHCASATSRELSQTTKTNASLLEEKAVELKRAHVELDQRKAEHDVTAKKLREATTQNKEYYDELTALQAHVRDHLAKTEATVTVSNFSKAEDRAHAAPKQAPMDPAAALSAFVRREGSASTTFLPNSSGNSLLGGAAHRHSIADFAI